MPEVNITPADSRALYIDKNLAWLQISSSLHNLQTGFRLRDPEVMRGVGVNTDISL